MIPEEVRRPMSLVQRLTRFNVAVLALAMVLSFALIQGMAFWSARAQQREGAEAAAALLAQNVAPMLAFQDSGATAAMLRDVARRADLRELVVLDARGQAFARWPEQGATEPAAELREMRFERDVMLQGERVGRLQWREAYASLETMLLRITMIGAMLLLAVLVLGANALHWVQKRSLAPLVALSDLTERVAATQDYALRAEVRKGDEVGRLAEHVNEMLRRIQVWHEDLHQQLHQERAAGHELQQLAHRDHLTGLPNRLSFDVELERLVVELQHGQRLGLLFIDLDHFKAINDQLGHEAGDEVLVEVARRMGGVLRTQDRLFRLGGDEFALLVAPMGSIAALEHLAGRLVAAVSAPLQVRGQTMPLGASIGGVIGPDHGLEAAELLRRADAAMYAAKAAGKNRYRLAGESDA